MKPKIHNRDFYIPSGWYQLENGTKINRTDKWWDDDGSKWNLTLNAGMKVCESCCGYTYIRRIRKPKATK